MIVLHGLVLLGLMIYFFKRTADDKLLFWSAWILRLIMGILVGLVYTYYYDANDTWNFFEDAKTLAALARADLPGYLSFLFTGNPDHAIWQSLIYQEERSLFFVKALSLLAWISGGSYWICSLYFSTISFAAAWILFRTVIRYFEKAKPAAALSFLFFPSVVFWSSGLVKETLALAGIFWMSAFFLRWLKGDRITLIQFLITFAALWFAWKLKYYWTALFVAVVLTSVLTSLIQRRKEGLKSYWGIVWVILLVTGCAVASQVHPNFYFSRFLEVIVNNHDEFAQISKPGVLIHFYNLQPDWWSMVLNSPWALISGLFRPWLGEANSLTGLLAAIENLLLLTLAVSACFRKSWKTGHTLLLTTVITYMVLLCVLMALSTPNLGTLSRYRVGFLPFFVFVISYGNPLLAKIRLSAWHRHT
ncbi:MAG: hypothetical protein KIT62_01960 [Cyclobacteriaceae bacterium]|nr:hypothetical protein [Cyclobacteriaceae bacterium]